MRRDPAVCALAAVGLALAAFGCAGPHTLAGSWRYESGTLVTECGGVSSSEPITGALRVEQGDVDLVQAKRGSCALAYAGGEDLASAPALQSCETPEGTLTVHDGQLVSRGDALLQTESGLLNVLGNDCTYALTAVLRRAE